MERIEKAALSQALKTVFDAIPKGRKPFPMREACYVEVAAAQFVAVLEAYQTGGISAVDELLKGVKP